MRVSAASVRTMAALGWRNLARVGWYRGLLKAGIHSAQRARGTPIAGPVFDPPALPPLDASASPFWIDEGLSFGIHRFAVGDDPPDWHVDPLSSRRAAGVDRSWWRIPDFDPAVGDIKRIWELSRWDWLPAMAQHARNGRAGAHRRLERWIADWVAHNPAYRGPNWKCGQEASIRVMHLAVAALVLGRVAAPTAGLVSLLETHLRRIAPTLGYAAAQDNNHGTSEAAALFIGGSWLALAGRPAGAGYARRGRAHLEERVARLVAPDGSFSQYSVTYHRLMLDTLSLAETWPRGLDLPAFSPRLRARAAAAAQWLRLMVVDGGDAPNLGANDGANLLPLTAASYRDFRPSVVLATALFAAQRAYPPGPSDDLARWLGVTVPTTKAPPVGSACLADGGYAVLRSGRAMAMVRFPQFRFRPGHADALHLDLWLGGNNVLRDGGSYSYNDGDEWIGYFGGVESHNTVQFDGTPQMPRLSRFLLADWLATDEMVPVAAGDGAVRFAAGYRDRRGRAHRRDVALTDHRLTVQDRVSGFERSAMLRWRLAPGRWEVTADGVTGDALDLRVSATVPIVGFRLVEGHESRHYLERTAVPVVEIELAAPGEITSEFRWT